MFKNYNNQIVPSYNTREERNLFCAELIESHFPDCKSILNIGSGGEEYLKKKLPNKEIFDIDITGTADLLVDLETLDRFNFKDGEFDISIALDLLEHIDNFHAILDEMFRCSSKKLLISLPNPYGVFMEMIRGKLSEDKDRGERGVYSKFYGLPLTRPIDRHKWHFSIDDVIALFTHYGERHNVKSIEYFSGHKWNMKKRIVYSLIGNRRYRNLFLPPIWIIVQK